MVSVLCVRALVCAIGSTPTKHLPVVIQVYTRVNYSSTAQCRINKHLSPYYLKIAPGSSLSSAASFPPSFPFPDCPLFFSSSTFSFPSPDVVKFELDISMLFCFFTGARCKNPKIRVLGCGFCGVRCSGRCLRPASGSLRRLGCCCSNENEDGL